MQHHNSGLQGFALTSSKVQKYDFLPQNCKYAFFPAVKVVELFSTADFFSPKKGTWKVHFKVFCNTDGH